MVQAPRIAMLVPLAVGTITVICTTIIHALPLRGAIDTVRREIRLGRVGHPWNDLGIFARIVFYAFLAHLVEIAFWGVLLMICREFRDFGTAFYHSAVNYTSLGYGDLLMTPSWRLLGPLETANGMLLFGVSTAMIFTVTQHLVRARFADLPRD